MYFFFMWSLLGYDRIAEHLCKFHVNLVAGGAGGGGKWSGKGGKVGAVAINKSNTFKGTVRGLKNYM
jgi:hypothetical protein